MARKHSPQHQAAICDLLKHLRVGAEVELVRSRYSTIPKATWYRLIAQAKLMFAAEGGTPIPPSPHFLLPMPPTGPARGRGRPRRPRVSDPTPEQLDALTKDSRTVIQQTLMGPKEYRVITRWTKPPEKELNGLSISDRMMELYFDATALSDASIKHVNGGHVILDANSLAKAIELKRAILSEYLKNLERSHNVETVRRLMKTLVKHAEGLPRETALALIDAMRKAAYDFFPQGAPTSQHESEE